MSLFSFRKSSRTTRTTRRPAHLGRGFLALEDRLVPAVDLLANSLGAPAIVAAGSTAPVKFSVVNIGSTPTTAPFSDAIFLSDDATLGGNDQLLRLVSKTDPVASNQGYGVSTSVAIPSTAVGLKNLILVSDLANQAGDIIRANNIRVIPLAVLAPTAVGPVTDLLGEVQSLIGGKLAASGVSADGRSVTFDVTNGQDYQFGGFRLTDVNSTVTVGLDGSVSANGTGNLHVPLSSANEVVIPVTFSATPTTLTVDGVATLPTFRYGDEPALITAQNVGLNVHLVADLTAGTVTGGVNFTAATARVLATNAVGQVPAGPVTLTNVTGSLSPTGQIKADAATVGITFRDFVSITGANARLSADINQTSGAVVTVASATATSPKFPGAIARLGAITVNADGFSIDTINLAATTINLPNSQINNFAMSVVKLAYTRQNGFSVGSMTATADRVVLYGGRATVIGVRLGFDGSTGQVTGSAASASGAIGSVSFTGGAATLEYAVGAQLPTVRLTTATVTMPVGGGTATLTATGFQLSADGRFRFDALAGLTLPQLNGQGISVTGSFSGDVHVSGATTIIHLQGQATAYGVPVRLAGDLTVSASGLFGVLDIQGAVGGAMPALGIAGGLSGEAHIAVNATNVDRTMTNDGQSRVVEANSVWVLASGTLMVDNFALSGTFDIFKEGDHWRANPTATLGLGGFGSFTVSGSFKVLASGDVVGSMSLVRATGVATIVAIAGTYRLDVNTTGAAQDGIPSGIQVVVSSASVDPGLGMTIQGTFTVGFRSDFYFASLTNASLSLWNGVASVRVNGEVRSNGVFSFNGSTQFVWDSGVGFTFNTGLTVSASRSTPGGGILFSATGSGGVSYLGLPLSEAVVSINQSGHVTLTYAVGQGAVTLGFNL